MRPLNPTKPLVPNDSKAMQYAYTVSPTSILFGTQKVQNTHKSPQNSQPCPFKHLPLNMGRLLCLSSLFPSSPLPPSNYQKPCHSAETMLSTLSSSDPLLSNPFSAFSTSFTPWDSFDPLFTFKTTLPTKHVITSSSGSGSDDRNPNNSRESNPSHDNKRVKLDRDTSVMDERKRRRMISNRESARRSRMRKQRHLENLRNQLNKCRVENRELSNRLQFILHHLNRVRTENEWLCSERTFLRQKLYQILVCHQLQPFDPTITTTTCMAMQ